MTDALGPGSYPEAVASKFVAISSGFECHAGPSRLPDHPLYGDLSGRSLIRTGNEACLLTHANPFNEHIRSFIIEAIPSP